MLVYFIGIGGSLNAAAAILAKEKGYDALGYDDSIYEPTLSQLSKADILRHTTLPDAAIVQAIDLFIIGNSFGRDHEAVKLVLNSGKPYISSCEFLSHFILPDYKVIAVAGTHGKSTVTAMITWILMHQKMDPSYLIGATSHNFDKNTHLGKGDYFVIEADEYDSAFYDKRPKFLHYHPYVAIINNIEFDHADIYDDLDAIALQFRRLVKTIPDNGLLIHPGHSQIENLVTDHGLWCPNETFGPQLDNIWRWGQASSTFSTFNVYQKNKKNGHIAWPLLGIHNAYNALAAIALANKIGIAPEQAIAALNQFKGAKRRMELFTSYRNTDFYDDFGHHPTAINLVLQTLQQKQDKQKLIVCLECASYTMRHGVHIQALADALKHADHVLIKQPDSSVFDINLLSEALGARLKIHYDINSLMQAVFLLIQPYDQVVLFSSRNFDNLRQKIIAHTLSQTDKLNID